MIFLHTLSNENSRWEFLFLPSFFFNTIMFRQLTRKSISTRSFAVTRAAFADAPSKGDAFKDRENAQETAYIKKHEAEQLAKLKAKLEEQKKVVSDLEKEIKEIKK